MWNSTPAIAAAVAARMASSRPAPRSIQRTAAASRPFGSVSFGFAGAMAQRPATMGTRVSATSIDVTTAPVMAMAMSE